METQLQECLNLFLTKGHVIEIRGLRGTEGVISGYFDNVADAIREVQKYEGKGNFYVTANPVSVDLLDTAKNVLQRADRTTSDKSIASRRWFLLDFDPIRPANVASTDEELQHAIAAREHCVRWLTEQGWPAPVKATSGNGAHALYPVKLPNTDVITALFHNVLKVLSAKFSTDDVTLDTTVYNASRIWRLYGTVNHKGKASEGRPHRLAVIEFIPSPLVAITRAQFDAFLPGVGDFDFVGLFKQRKLYIRDLGRGRHAVTCLWKDAHTTDSGVTQTMLFDPTSDESIDGGWGYKCQHSHCAERTIGDVKKAFDVGVFIRTSKGQIAANNQENIRRAVRLLDEHPQYNAFSDRLLSKGVSLEDNIVNTWWLAIDRVYRFRPERTFFFQVVQDMAWHARFHPVKDYLDALEWDGIPRINTWMIDSGGAEDTPYVRAVSAILLIAAVRRIRDPGCKYDELVVLESPQGMNKSSALRALCPRGDWFSDDLPLNARSQQIIEATSGKWIIEASELSGLRPSQTERLKSMLSRQVDGPARMAYAHLPAERPRQFILVGTTNDPAYLTDASGARRFWPILVRKFDLDWIMTHRDQLWAEASYRERKGESIRLAEDLWPDAAEAQEQRQEIDPWEDVIREVEAQPYESDRYIIFTSDIWRRLDVPLERRDRRGGIRISHIMQRLGYTHTTARNAEGHVERAYVRERAPGEEG